MISRNRPLILIQGIDCRDWTILQDNVNYVRRKVLLNMRRAKARKILKKVVEWCLEQNRQGGCWLIENFLTSRLWLEAACHAGAYGAVSRNGQPIRKAHRFLGNCPLVLERLQHKLTQEQQQACVPLEGKDTTLSGIYPPEMVSEILKGVRDLARR